MNISQAPIHGKGTHASQVIQKGEAITFENKALGIQEHKEAYDLQVLCSGHN